MYTPTNLKAYRAGYADAIDRIKSDAVLAEMAAAREKLWTDYRNFDGPRPTPKMENTAARDALLKEIEDV